MGKILDISIIIVNWNTKDLLLEAISSIYRTVVNLSFEIWLVDNASVDSSVQDVKHRFPEVHIIENRTNKGFAAANNQAFKQMNGRYAILLNTDTVLTDGALNELYNFMETAPKTGAACGQLINSDGSKQNSIANFPSLLLLLTNETILRLFLPKRYPSKWKTYESPVKIESCIGACMIVRRKTMDDVGFFDESFFFFFEETDWAYRMRNNGWKIYFVPSATIYHKQGKSAGSDSDARIMFYRSRYIFIRKWYKRTFLLMNTVIFSRLLVNTLLTALGILFTAGLNPGLKKKLLRYMDVITWHLKGCPDKTN